MLTIGSLPSFVQGLLPAAPAAPAPAPAPAPKAPAGDAMAFTGKAAAAHWAGTVAGRAIRWDAQDVTADGFSLKAYLAKRADLANATGTATAEVKLLAAAGDYLSVRETWNTFHGLYDQTFTTFTTVDLRTGEAAKLTDLFPADDLRRALLADPAVQRAMRETGVKKPAATLDGLLEQLAGATIYGSKDRDILYSGQLYAGSLDNFALYNAGNGKVGVRFVLDQPGGVHHTTPVQIGLVLPTPPALRDPLAKAASGREGVLMDRASRIGQTTTFDYSSIMQPLPNE